MKLIYIFPCIIWYCLNIHSEIRLMDFWFEEAWLLNILTPQTGHHIYLWSGVCRACGSSVFVNVWCTHGSFRLAPMFSLETTDWSSVQVPVAFMKTHLGHTLVLPAYVGSNGAVALLYYYSKSVVFILFFIFK